MAGWLEEQRLQRPLNYEVGLKVVGIVLLLYGALPANVMFLRGIAEFIPGATIEPVPQFIAGPWTIPAVVYRLLMVIVLFALGYGSVRAFRWAPQLTVVSAWLCLVGGLIFIPMMAQALDPSNFTGNNNPDRDWTLAMFNLAQLFFYCVLIPIPVILFCSSRGLRKACELRDSTATWLDTCPPTILVQSLLFLFLPINLLLHALAHESIPVLGYNVHGLSGVLVALGATSLCIWILWGVYRMRTSAWRWTLAFVVVCGLAFGDEFYRTGLIDLLQGLIARGNLAQAGAVAASRFLHFGPTPWMLLYLYLVFHNRRYFLPST